MKKVFRDHDINISFGYYERNFDDNTIFKRKTPYGKVIALLTINDSFGRIGSEGGKNMRSLHFYVLNNEEYSDRMEIDFVEKIIPQLFNAFYLHKDGNPSGISCTRRIIVELQGNNFFISENITN